MNWQLLSDHAAIITGALIGAAIVLVWAARTLKASGWQRLRRARKNLRLWRRELATVSRAAEKADHKLEKLRAKSDRVKPRHIWKAEEQVSVLRREVQQARDELRVAEKEVRRVIQSEYPPAKQERLLRKLLPEL